jgi:hypothetical protein
LVLVGEEELHNHNNEGLPHNHFLLIRRMQQLLNDLDLIKPKKIRNIIIYPWY